MYGHDCRVGVMGWSKHVLSTGARSGLVHNHDVRIAQHQIAELVSHTAEVCGLEWRPDSSQLATGGNDNLVSIWDARSLGGESIILHPFSVHPCKPRDQFRGVSLTRHVPNYEK